MSEHTKEPWTKETHSVPGYHVNPHNHPVVLSRQDFERACACVNLLAGVPTSDIPAIAMLLGVLQAEFPNQAALAGISDPGAMLAEMREMKLLLLWFAARARGDLALDCARRDESWYIELAEKVALADRLARLAGMGDK